MINQLLEALNEPSLNMSINIIAHSIIFIGAFYIAMFNKRLPVWHVTPLWYVGLTSLFSVLTIIFEYFFGPNFPLSNFNMNLFAETILNLALAYLVLVMFVSTVIVNRKTKK